MTTAATAATAGKDNTNILVVVDMVGGNDGFNTVIPSPIYNRALYEQYQSLRPTLAIPPSELGSTMLPSSVGYALNPWMGGTGGTCLLYTSPSPRDGLLSRMPSSA